ncbi:MAG: acyltransferase [Gemmatimonadaceae bacterium]
MQSLWSRVLKAIWNAVLLLLPSRLKVELLRLRGHDVSRQSHIGMSWLDIGHISLRDGARIGPFNVFKGMAVLDMAANAEIGRFNQFTANRYYSGIAGAQHGRVTLAKGAVITMRHYFDCQSSVSLGEDSLIAGIGSVFFTHQKGVHSLNEAAPISIGPRVYLGAACVVLPGAFVRGRAYISSGSIVSGVLDEQDVLYASPKASVVKALTPDASYFATDKPTAHFDEAAEDD